MKVLNLSEALTIFNPHLSDIKEALIENMNYAISQLHTPTNWIQEEVRKIEVQNIIEKPSRVVKRIVALQQPRTVSQAFNSITDADIERAKEFPIEELYDGTLQGGMGKCPFHEDKTASLSFRRYNRFRCFGCDARGSVIDYYMKKHNVDFIRAVQQLQG